jgi:hypothetical protein
MSKNLSGVPLSPQKNYNYNFRRKKELRKYFSYNDLVFVIEVKYRFVYVLLPLL